MRIIVATLWMLCAMLSHSSRVQLYATLWTVVCQVSLSTGFSRQEYWSGLPCPSLGDLPAQEIESIALMSPALAGGFFTTSATWEAPERFHTGMQKQTVKFSEIL